MELYDQLENETNPTSFTCQATGEPIPTITWYFNGDMINVTSKYRTNSTVINTTTIEGMLEIYNASSSDVGTYICSATNELGTKRSVGVLTIHGKKNNSLKLELICHMLLQMLLSWLSHH